jgi:hypothetical protein
VAARHRRGAVHVRHACAAHARRRPQRVHRPVGLNPNGNFLSWPPTSAAKAQGPRCW